MLSPTPHSETFYGALAEMAEKLRHTIIGMPDGERLAHVQRRVAKSEIVFGVWPDPNGAGGFGFHPIKGRGHLTILNAKLPDKLTTTAIPCVGIDQAMAAEEIWGERLPQTPLEAAPPVKAGKTKRKPEMRRASADTSASGKRGRGTHH